MGLDKKADINDVKKAYKKACLKGDYRHPDKGGDPENVREWESCKYLANNYMQSLPTVQEAQRSLRNPIWCWEARYLRQIRNGRIEERWRRWRQWHGHVPIVLWRRWRWQLQVAKKSETKINGNHNQLRRSLQWEDDWDELEAQEMLRRLRRQRRQECESETKLSPDLSEDNQDSLIIPSPPRLLRLALNARVSESSSAWCAWVLTPTLSLKCLVITAELKEISWKKPIDARPALATRSSKTRRKWKSLLNPVYLMSTPTSSQARLMKL